jgi:hypothetical protein
MIRDRVHRRAELNPYMSVSQNSQRLRAGSPGNGWLKPQSRTMLALLCVSKFDITCFGGGGVGFTSKASSTAAMMSAAALGSQARRSAPTRARSGPRSACGSLAFGDAPGPTKIYDTLAGRLALT